MLTTEEILSRSGYIGGSDVAIILGLSPYKTAYQLYLEKIGVIHPDLETTERMLWGSLLESVVRDQFAARNNVVVESPAQLTHPKYEFIKGNLDGFIPSLNAILEVKCSSAFMMHQWGESGSTEIPVQYLVQVAMYCAIADVDCAYVVVLIDGADYREYKYERNLDLEETLIQQCVKFWQCVQTQNPPPAITIDDLKLMHLRVNEGSTKEASDHIHEHVQSLKGVREQIKELVNREEHHKFELMKFMQDSESLVCSEGKTLVTWRQSKRGRVLLLK